MISHRRSDFFLTGISRSLRRANCQKVVICCAALLTTCVAGQAQNQRAGAMRPRVASAPPNTDQNIPVRRSAAGTPAQTPTYDDYAAEPTGARNFRPNGVIQAGGPLPQTGGPMIQQVQNTPESARAVHHLIESMPTSQEELQLIERRSQLIIAKANIVRMAIADETILDVAQYSPREISLIGRTRGSTTLTLWFDGQIDPLIYLIQVVRDPNLDNQRRVDYGKLERKINSLFPNSKVFLIPMSYKIIVRGQARDQEEAANILNVIQGEVINQEGSLFGGAGNMAAAGDYGGGYGGGAGGGDAFGNGMGYGGLGFGNVFAGFIVNELKVPGEFQINVRCVVAELNRSQARNLGVDLSVLFNGGQLIQSTMGGAPGTIAGVFSNGDISLLVNWLATNGTAKILTEPNTTVLSGRPARFLAGGEFAVPTIVGIAGAAGQTTTFRGFGTSMLVTPTVVDRDLIRLMAIAEFSELNSGNTVNDIPGLDTRRVQTTVELREGQTLALGGLLSQTMTMEISRIPFLGDIPKIGPLLFSNKKSSLDETELLILVTPEIVRPIDAQEVPPVPGFEVTYPQDTEFWKYNMTEGLPDTGYYQVPPYGSGAVGTNVGYQHFNPGPANSLYSPVPNANGGFTAPPGQSQMPTPIQSVPPAAPGMELAPPPPSPTPISPGSGPIGGQPLGQRGAPMNSRTRERQNPAMIQQAGWSTPQPPAASPQAMVPSNEAPSGPGAAGNSGRIRRDQQRSSRY